MSLEDLIYRNRKRQVATATVATPATHGAGVGSTVAKAATVAVANPRNAKTDGALIGRASATATPATVATHEARSETVVASAARAAKPPEAANDPTIVPADCVGALHSDDGGLYLPWGPCLSADDVRRMRGELVGMIETLADMENWDEGRRDDVLTRAIRGPLADLLPNLAHFNERLAAARADAQARKIADARAYRVTDDVLRRWGYRV